MQRQKFILLSNIERQLIENPKKNYYDMEHKNIKTITFVEKTIATCLRSLQFFMLQHVLAAQNRIEKSKPIINSN